MGVWGSGILQNDGAQDGLVGAAGEIIESLRALTQSRADDGWADMFAAVGLLMRFSPYSFEPDNPDNAVVRRAVELHRAGGAAGRELDAVLDTIALGQRLEYEMSTLPPELERALHGESDRGFPMQKTWADAPERCFAFGKSKAFVQAFADRRVARIDEELADDDTLVDLCRESDVMGDFALLLILDEIHVDPKRFRAWREAWREARDHDESEADFFERYYASVEAGFEYALARFS